MKSKREERMRAAAAAASSCHGDVGDGEFYVS
jgi:hypothetical protein